MRKMPEWLFITSLWYLFSHSFFYYSKLQGLHTNPPPPSRDNQTIAFYSTDFKEGGTEGKEKRGRSSLTLGNLIYRIVRNWIDGALSRN